MRKLREVTYHKDAILNYSGYFHDASVPSMQKSFVVFTLISTISVSIRAIEARVRETTAVARVAENGILTRVPVGLSYCSAVTHDQNHASLEVAIAEIYNPSLHLFTSHQYP